MQRTDVEGILVFSLALRINSRDMKGRGQKIEDKARGLCVVFILLPLSFAMGSIWMI